MKTRGRKILRDIWSRKARTVLVSISIFIGVFGTVTLFTMSDLVVNQLKHDLDENALAMTRAYLGVPPNTTPDNAAVLDTLGSQPDVAVVEGQAVFPVYWKLDGGTTFKRSFIFGYSEPYDSLQLEPPTLVKGRFPQDGTGVNELAVERRFADKYHVSVGDTLTVRALSQVDPGSGTVPEETWTIVGIVFHPYGYQTFTTVLPEESVFATYDSAQHLAAFNGFSSIYVRYQTYAQDEQNVDSFIQSIAHTGSYIPVVWFSEDPAQNSQIAFARTSGNVMVSLAMIALLVSGFLVFNVLNAIVTEQKQQIGVMKSLGATGWDNVFIYSGMALVYGVIGVILGIALGIPTGFVAAKGMAASSNSMIDKFAYSPTAIILGVVVGLAVPVLASLVPVLNAMRVTIIDAITDLGIASRYGSGPLARLVGRLPLPVTIRQGISNVIRKKGRILLTVITLTLAAGSFMGIYAVFASVDKVLNDFFDTYNFEFTVEPNDPNSLPVVNNVLAQNFSDLNVLGPYASMAIEIDGFDKKLDPATGPGRVVRGGLRCHNQRLPAQADRRRTACDQPARRHPGQAHRRLPQQGRGGHGYDSRRRKQRGFHHRWDRVYALRQRVV